MKRNGNLVLLSRKLQTDLTSIANEYDLTNRYLNDLNSGAGANYSGPQEQLDITNRIRQARSASMGQQHLCPRQTTPQAPIGRPRAPNAPAPWTQR